MVRKWRETALSGFNEEGCKENVVPDQDSSAINKSWEKRVAVKVIDMIEAHSQTVHEMYVTENTINQRELDLSIDNHEFE